MRMWMIKPALLCNKHLNGEHSELHKHRHIFVKGYSIKGRLHPVTQIQPLCMKERHDELAEEMLKRGMNHRSPYEQPDLKHYDLDEQCARVNIRQSMYDLSMRCAECRKRINGG